MLLLEKVQAFIPDYMSTGRQMKTQNISLSHTVSHTVSQVRGNDIKPLSTNLIPEYAMIHALTWFCEY